MIPPSILINLLYHHPVLLFSAGCPCYMFPSITWIFANCNLCTRCCWTWVFFKILSYVHVWAQALCALSCRAPSVPGTGILFPSSLVTLGSPFGSFFPHLSRRMALPTSFPDGHFVPFILTQYPLRPSIISI